MVLVLVVVAVLVVAAIAVAAGALDGPRRVRRRVVVQEPVERALVERPEREVVTERRVVRDDPLL